MKVAFLLLVILLSFLSIRERVRQRRRRFENGSGQPPPAESPISHAIVSLVSVAGGIYLALIMIVEFLKAPVPSRIEIWGISIDPIAGVSLLIAIVQPFISRLFPPNS